MRNDPSAIPVSRRHLLGRGFFVLCILFHAFLAAAMEEDIDLRTASPADFFAIFSQLGDGLEYSESGELVRVAGSRLPYNDATRAALIHLVARDRPVVTTKVSRMCSSCGGKGKGFRLEGREGINIGHPVQWVCSACSGQGFFSETATRRVFYSGELPKKWDSPRLIAFRKKLDSARDGSPAMQLEVASAYLQGDPVARSLEEARSWYTKAAVQGEKSALAPLSRLYLDPSASFHDQAFGLALSALAYPESVVPDAHGFMRFKRPANDAATPESGLKRRLEVLEAGLLASRIAKGLQDKIEAEKVMTPQTVRSTFPAMPSSPSGVPAEARAAYVLGLARYFGHGLARPDPDSALRLLESAASRRDLDALVLLAMHFDVGRAYPASPSTAWAFYSVAAKSGSDDPFVVSRLRQMADTDVPSEWEGSVEVLLHRFQAGDIQPAMLRDLADLSLYRKLRPVSTSGGSTAPYDTSGTQGSPLSKPQVFSRARSLLMRKLAVVELGDEDVSVVRRCWGDGNVRFYSVSGLVTFTDASSRRMTEPYTLCFRIDGVSLPPTLLYLSAGTSQFGEFPLQCGRHP